MAEPSPAEVNAKVKKAVVYLGLKFTGAVQVPFKGGARWTEDIDIEGHCTGFVVDPAGYIATAGHCVNADPMDFYEKVANSIAGGNEADAAQLLSMAYNNKWPVRGANGSGDAPTVKVRVKQPDGENQLISAWSDVQVVASEKFGKGDNAVVRLNNPPSGLVPLPIVKNLPTEGDPITSVGFPGGVARVSDQSMIPQPSFKTGTVSSRQKGANGNEQTEVSATIGTGMSGGPTVNAKGEVIGINSFKNKTQPGGESSEFAFVTDPVDLRSFLQSNGANLSAADSDEDSGFNLMWVLIPVAVVVLLAALIGFFVIRGRKGKGTPPGMPGGGMPLPVGGYGQSPNPFAAPAPAPMPRPGGFGPPPRPAPGPAPQPMPQPPMRPPAGNPGPPFGGPAPGQFPGQYPGFGR
ncbi:trypsin-like peptidase domain-containing protein [Gordonia sp. X0973]|nr:trypsin-like peptidase domain-containing protein [Gordonia sp. X0973]